MEDQLEYGTSEPVMSVKDWVITFLILAIPLVNIIMLFIWAFGSDTSLTKQNFAKGALIFYAIIAILYILALILFGSFIFASMSQGMG